MANRLRASISVARRGRSFQGNMKHQKSTSFVAASLGAADRGTLLGAVRLLLPYIWPVRPRRSETARHRRDCFDVRLQVRHHCNPLFFQMGDRRIDQGSDGLGRVGSGVADRRDRADLPLWRASHGDGVDPASARRVVRGGRHERRAVVWRWRCSCICTTSPCVFTSSGRPAA